MLPVVWMILSAGSAMAETCDALSGTVSLTGECEVSTVVTATGTVTITRPLRLVQGGAIVIPPLLTGGANFLTINVIGDMTMDVGSRIFGDVTPADGQGATITLNVTGSIRLRGDGTTATSARISSNGSPNACASSPAGPGRAGNINLLALDSITLETGTVVQSNAQCPAGEIVLSAARGNITTGGVVEAASGNALVTFDTVGRPRGGPITLTANGDITLLALGKTSSRGLAPGADLVSLQAGGDIKVFGLVESTGGANTNTTVPNRCGSTVRPDKPFDAPACINVQAGGTLTVDASGPSNSAGLNADTAPASAGGIAKCCAWIDVFARGDITIAGRSSFSTPGPFPIRANQFIQNSFGGRLNIKTATGAVNVIGTTNCSEQNCYIPAFQANALVFGGNGGRVAFEASGDVNLGFGGLRARGGLNSGTGGRLSVRSYNGTVRGRQPSELNTFGGTGVGSSVLEIFNCIQFDYTGFQIPPATLLNNAVCGGGPETPPSPRRKDIPIVTVTGGVFPFDGLGHPATGTVTGLNNLSLGTPTITYLDESGNAVPVPIVVGTYQALATYAGNADYTAASATATVIIFRDERLAPTIRVTGGTYTYDGLLHPAVGSTTGASGEDLGISLLYNGLNEIPKNAGTYNVVGTFAGNERYTPATATATVIILKATPVIQIVGTGTFDFTGNPRPAFGYVSGVNGEDLGQATMTYNGCPGSPGCPTNPNDSIPLRVGTYNVVASYPGSQNYYPATATATTIIQGSSPIINVPSVTVTYDGRPHGTTASVVGLSGEQLGSATVSYQTETGQPVIGTPVNAGTYIVIATYPGDPIRGYSPVTVTTARVVINKATPTVTITGGTFTYDRLEHPATNVGARGVLVGNPAAPEVLTPVTVGYTLSGSPVTTPVNAGTYQATASFAGNANYNPASNTTTIVIEKATPRITLVGGSFRFDGNPHPALSSISGLPGDVPGPGPLVVTYVGLPGPPTDIGTYPVTASFAGDDNYRPATATAIIVIQLTCASCDPIDGVVVVDQNVRIDFNPATPTCTGSAALCASFTFDKNGATPDSWRAIFNLGGKKLLVRNGATIWVMPVRTKSHPHDSHTHVEDDLSPENEDWDFHDDDDDTLEADDLFEGKLKWHAKTTPGIRIETTCDVEIEEGAAIFVGAKKHFTGDIVIRSGGHILVNGTILTFAKGGHGMPGDIILVSTCGGITTGPNSMIRTWGYHHGAGDIALVTGIDEGCGLGGNIVINGVVDATYKKGANRKRDPDDDPAEIDIVAFDGTVTIDGTNLVHDLRKPKLSGKLAGTLQVHKKYMVPSGVFARTRKDEEHHLGPRVYIQAKDDITVVGNTIPPKVQKSLHIKKDYRDVFAVTAWGGGHHKKDQDLALFPLVDVRSIAGGITASNRAFGAAGRKKENRGSVSLAAKGDITLTADPALTDCDGDQFDGDEDDFNCANTNTVVFSGTRKGYDRSGGMNLIRSYSGQVLIGLNAEVRATTHHKKKHHGGVNYLISCRGVVNQGRVDPPDLNTTDDSGVCSPAAPEPLFEASCSAPPPPPPPPPPTAAMCTSVGNVHGRQHFKATVHGKEVDVHVEAEGDCDLDTKTGNVFLHHARLKVEVSGGVIGTLIDAKQHSNGKRSDITNVAISGATAVITGTWNGAPFTVTLTDGGKGNKNDTLQVTYPGFPTTVLSAPHDDVAIDNK